jgi:hypothetical protein
MQATGLFFYEQSVEAISAAVKQFEKQQHYFLDRQAIRQNARRFRPAVFKNKIRQCVAAAARQLGLNLPFFDFAHDGETSKATTGSHVESLETIELES